MHAEVTERAIELERSDSGIGMPDLEPGVDRTTAAENQPGGQARRLFWVWRGVAEIIPAPHVDVAHTQL